MKLLHHVNPTHCYHQPNLDGTATCINKVSKAVFRLFNTQTVCMHSMKTVYSILSYLDYHNLLLNPWSLSL